MQSSSCRLVPEVRETRTAAGTQTAGVFSIPLIPPIAIGKGGGGALLWSSWTLSSSLRAAKTR